MKGLVHSLTMTGDYQSVHINRNFILNVFVLTRVHCIVYTCVVVLKCVNIRPRS